MELEFGEALGGQGDQASVVGAGRDFGEVDVVTGDEQFHAEESVPPEGVGDAGATERAFSKAMLGMGMGCQDST